MTAMNLRAACAGVLAVSALAACTAEPRYPIREGEAPGAGVELMQPRYPIRAQEAPPPAPAAALPRPAAVADDAPRAAPSGEVSTTALPPPSAPAKPVPYAELERRTEPTPRPPPRALAGTAPYGGRGPRPYAGLTRKSAGIASTPSHPGIAPQSLPLAASAAPSAFAPGAVAGLGRGRFVWPVRGAILSRFGAKGLGQRNDGVDIAAGPGDPVHAAAAGEVVYAGDHIPGYGNLVLVKHPGGWVTAYAHLSHIDVKMRESVAQGEPVGEAGQTGAVDRPQVHFEIRYAAGPAEKARPVDPVTLLPAAG